MPTELDRVLERPGQAIPGYFKQELLTSLSAELQMWTLAPAMAQTRVLGMMDHTCIGIDQPQIWILQGADIQNSRWQR